MNTSYNAYTDEFKNYAVKTLEEYKVNFQEDDITALQHQNSLQKFNKNLIKFSKELNAKADQLCTTAAKNAAIDFSNTQKEIFTLGKEYIKEFTKLFK